MQKRFEVTVIDTRRCVITVEAKNEQEAREKALDIVSDAPGDYFEPDYPDYDTEKVVESQEA